MTPASALTLRLGTVPLARGLGGRSRASGRRSTVVRATWSPWWQQGGAGSGGEQQSPFHWPQSQPETPERFRSLFAAPYIPPSENPATVWDARDALETCSGLWGEQRRDCLTVFGLDAEAVDTYYAAVLTLEQSLTHDTDPEEEASHRGQERC